MTTFEPTLLVKYVIEVKMISFSPFQDIFSYNYIEFLKKYREMHERMTKISKFRL